MRALDYYAAYASARAPVFGRDAIATSHPLASQAGMAMLMRGGNAVDAVIAAAMALTIVEPTGCGIGSDEHPALWAESAGGGRRAALARSRWPPRRGGAEHERVADQGA